MENDVLIRFADTEDINTIGFLAQQIWPVAYGEIISREQMDYMLNMFYSPASLTQQIKTDKHQFVIAELDENPVGFASYSTADGLIYRLHKLYILPGIQGKGLGKALIDFIKAAIAPGATALQLGVNKNNKAIKFYEKQGFVIIKDVVTDIGHGFVMDDYIMEQKLI